MQPWRCVLKIVLAGGLAFPLAAQPVSPPETPVGQSELGGVLEHMRLSNGAKVVFQSDPNLPVVAVTLVQPWGSADDPANLPGLTRELARSVSRTSTSLPGGALLVRLNRIGGRTSFFCGRRWTSWTLVVPKHYADWAVQIQLERLNGPSLRGEDLEGSGAGSGRVELELFSRQHWDPQRATLAVTGGYNATSVLSRLQRAQLPQPPAPPSAATASTPGFGKGLLYTAPTSATQWAQALYWQQQLGLDCDPAHEGLLLDQPDSSVLRLCCCWNAWLAIRSSPNWPRRYAIRRGWPSVSTVAI